MFSCKETNPLQPNTLEVSKLEHATITGFPTADLPSVFNDDTKFSYTVDAAGKYHVTFKADITFPENLTKLKDNVMTDNPNIDTNPTSTGSDGYDNDLRSFSTGSERGFYWKVPSKVVEIIINTDVTVRGGFWSSGQNLLIRGASNQRGKHTIKGTELGYWKNKRTKNTSNEWRYTMIEGYGGGTVTIKNLTVTKARTYNINSYDTKMIADNIVIKNGRDVKETQGNNDGFGGGANSTISNSLINVTDDGIKFYRNNQKAINCTIHHNFNGAPFQFGWYDEPGATGCEIKDCKIIRNATEANHNLAPLTLTNRNSSAGNLAVSVTITKGGDSGIEGLEFQNGDYTNKKIYSQFSNQPNIPLVAARTSLTTGTVNNASITITGKNNVSGFTSSDTDLILTQGKCTITLNN